MEIALSKYLGSSDIITPCMPIEEEAVRRKLGFRGPQNFSLPLSGWKPRHYLDFALGHRPKRFSAHSNAQQCAEYLDKETFSLYRKILVVRNPYTYVVSLYNWHARSTGPTAEDFKAWLLAGEGDLRFSNYGMGKVDGQFVMDIVLQFENIAEDVRRLAETLDLPEELLTVFNSIDAKKWSAYPKLSIDQAYGFFPGARDLVEARFQEEIRIFDYVFPL